MSRDWSQLSPRRRCYCFSPAQITWSQRQPRPPNLLIHFPPTYLPCTDSITSFWRQTHLPPTQTLFGNNNKPALLIYVKYWYIPWVHPVQVYHSVGFGIQDTQPFGSSNRLIGPSLPPKLTQFLFLCTPLTLILLLLLFFFEYDCSTMLSQFLLHSNVSQLWKGSRSVMFWLFATPWTVAHQAPPLTLGPASSLHPTRTGLSSLCYIAASH